ncbi:MAG TPA: hypothetical protein VLA04_00665 [Verrucomicrobiae bacterium]|nr:hypothetical protein [Verrucomicrobiae bacterium]
MNTYAKVSNNRNTTKNCRAADYCALRMVRIQKLHDLPVRLSGDVVDDVSHSAANVTGRQF